MCIDMGDFCDFKFFNRNFEVFVIEIPNMNLNSISLASDRHRQIFFQVFAGKISDFQWQDKNFENHRLNISKFIKLRNFLFELKKKANLIIFGRDFNCHFYRICSVSNIIN